MFIDPHVHLRDGKQSHKETVKHGLSVAERAGMTAVFDMPNTDPLIITRESVIERLALARDADSPVKYGLFIGLTKERDQIEEAVKTHAESFRPDGSEPFTVGLKLFTCNVGSELSVSSPEDQKNVFHYLHEFNYQGVVNVHAENDLHMKDCWDPRMPISHAIARHPGTEVSKIEYIIEVAYSTGFQGHVHITHISVPRGVGLVYQAKKDGYKISCGVTPHHLLWSADRMGRHDGLLFKMNPPLRPYPMNKELLRCLKDGKIDWIESDHAPHTIEEKLSGKYPSGIPGLHFYPHFVSMLKKDFSDERIKALTFDNIMNVFGLQFNQRSAGMPSVETCRKLGKEYSFDPYKEMYCSMNEAVLSCGN